MGKRGFLIWFGCFELSCIPGRVTEPPSEAGPVSRVTASSSGRTRPSHGALQGAKTSYLTHELELPDEVGMLLRGGLREGDLWNKLPEGPQESLCMRRGGELAVPHHPGLSLTPLQNIFPYLLIFLQSGQRNEKPLGAFSWALPSVFLTSFIHTLGQVAMDVGANSLFTWIPS